jgi:hypothetical protein
MTHYQIKYAYPSSDMSKQLKRSATGCFYVELDGICTNEPFDSLEDAKAFAESTGYVPNKYTMK